MEARDAAMSQQTKILISSNSGLQADLFEAAFGSIGASTARTKLAEAAATAVEVRPNIVFFIYDLVGPGVIKAISSVRNLRLRPAPYALCFARTSSETGKIIALEAGADEVFSEPVALNSILGRIRYFMHQASPGSLNTLTIGDVRINLAEQTVVRSGRTIRVTPTEFRILGCLMANSDKVMSRQALSDAVWGPNATLDPRTIDVTVGRIRRTLSRPKEINPIKSVRGAGYVFRF